MSEGLSERYTTDVLHLLADRHLTKERERLLAYRDEIAKLERERDRLRDACRAVISAYDGRGVFRATYDTVRAALEGGEG